MTEYYTMESVRDIIISRRYDIRTSSYDPVPLPGWNRYPCVIIKKCEKKGKETCTGYVSIYINTDEIKWIFIEICFYRKTQRAFIRAEGSQMEKLIELKIIDENKLIKEVF
jgi:hypothetical protein